MTCQLSWILDVTCVEPKQAGAGVPEWSQDGGVVKLACDGLAFAYRVEFE